MSNDNSQSGSVPKRSASDLVSIGKDFVALLRDSALFLLALLLIVFPGQFNSILSKAGFEEGSIVGMKWKVKLTDSDQALKEARATIADLKSQLDKTTQALGAVRSKPDDPALKDATAKLEEENRRVSDASSKVEASVSNTIAASAPLVEKAQEATSSGTSWGVVYSGDTSLKDARYEATEAASKFGIPNAKIYFRQGSYRSVSVASSLSEARQVIPKAKQRRGDAYLVDLSKWCPVSNEKDGYLECLSR